MALEGELNGLTFDDLPGVETSETPALRRQTRWPKQKFVTFPLTAHTVELLKDRLASASLFEIGGPIDHAQVACGDALVLLAADNFHSECVSAFPPTPESLLERLQADGIIRSYRAAA